MGEYHVQQKKSFQGQGKHKHEKIKIYEKGKKNLPNLKPFTPTWLQNIIRLIWRYLNKPITSKKLIAKNVPASWRWDIQEEEEFELQIEFHC